MDSVEPLHGSISFLIGDKEGRFSKFSQLMPEIAHTTLIKSGFSSDLSFSTSLLTLNLESMEGSQKIKQARNPRRYDHIYPHIPSKSIYLML